MGTFSDLTSERRIEAYRDLGLAAVEKSRRMSGRDAALYLNLAAQWMRLADRVASRTRREMECDTESPESALKRQIEFWIATLD
jgi:deoxyadenosine/deoxycytidine kinase